MAGRTAGLHVDGRHCVGCGRRKLDCPCWLAGAGDEAMAQRADFDRDQLALLDYLRTRMAFGTDALTALGDALRVELAHDRPGMGTRVRLAWRALFE